jgi:TolB protein
MKNICIGLLLFLFGSGSLHAEIEDTGPIYVRLATENQLLPLYLTKISSTGSGFDNSYVEKLREILRFDLNYNGMTEVVKNTSDKDSLLENKRLDDSVQLSAWKASNIFYVVKAEIKDKNLSANMLLVNNHSLKNVEGITLTGDLSQDRKSIHKLADAIHRSLFNTDGIANTRIIYTVKKKISDQNWIADVWEADYDGGNARQITDDNALIVSPIYVPPKPGFKSGNIVYVSYKNGQPKMFFRNLKSNDNQRVTLLRGNQLMPAINRDRNKLAFICDVAGNPDIFVLSFTPEGGAVGKPRQIFATPHKATQGGPTFNPDGTEVAFVSNKDGKPRIYTLKIPDEGQKINDIKPVLVSKQNRESTAPAWSPDGTKIAYSAMTDGVRQIWLYDLNTKQERQITQGAGHKENPTWAPDSLHIMFNSQSRDLTDLYLINLNQHEAVKITSGAGEKRFPNWEPRS